MKGSHHYGKNPLKQTKVEPKEEAHFEPHVEEKLIRKGPRNLQKQPKEEALPTGPAPIKQTDPLDYGRLDDAKDFNKKYQARKNMPKNFNMTNKKDAFDKTSKEILSRSKKAFSDTPKQMAKKGKQVLKTSNKNFISGTKQVLKAAKPIVKNVAKRFLGPVGVALTAYDIATTLPKAVKATKKSLRKEAKERASGSATDLFRGPKY